VKFRVVVTPAAESGIRQAFDYIHQRSPLNAARWLQRLYEQVDTLEYFPERCGKARETEYLEEDLRQLLFRAYRIVFRIDKAQKTVYVLHVQHKRRRAVGEPGYEEC
jgi:plasmid stabilization system protein ParE